MNPGERRLLTLGAAAGLTACAAAAATRGSLRSFHACGLAATALLLGPTLIRNSAWWGPVITKLDREDRAVWLTIDDGPDPHDTPQILEVLDRHRARASFFVIGHKVMRYPDAARAIADAGHDLQNHTWSHAACRFWAAHPRCARSEIENATRAITHITGRTPRFFRAPAGLANPFVHEAAERTGLAVAGWSASANDGVRHDPTRVVGRIMRRVQPGAVILLHEGHAPGLAPGERARTLDRLLQRLAEEGYRTVAAP